MTTKATKLAALSLRDAARKADYVYQKRHTLDYGDACRLLGDALRAIESAQTALRNDPCWIERANADAAAVQR